MTRNFTPDRTTAIEDLAPPELPRQAVLEVTGFSKKYGPRMAVDQLSFHVSGGQILGLLGANGAGKTTTMKCIVGIVPPTSGRLSIGGHDIQSNPVAAKALAAYVPDEPVLFDTLTVWEHLQFMAGAHRLRDWKSHGEALLNRFNMWERRNSVSKELSRGMRQKVAIACALLHRPRLVMFDEPLTGLDPHGIRSIKEVIVECARAGSAVILSSHLLVLVEGLCTDYLILDRGQMRFHGSPSEAQALFADPGAESGLEDLFFRAVQSPVSHP
jgi:ABC-2 type transport system ATP-binding protein